MRFGTPLRSVILFAFLVVTIFVITCLTLPPKLFAVVEFKGIAVYRGPLNEDRKITIRAAHGDVRVQIRRGSIGIVYADCEDHLCTRAGWRSRLGDSIECVSNKVVLRIKQ